eukprot:2410811-Rhodomonas_salina.2
MPITRARSRSRKVIAPPPPAEAASVLLSMLSMLLILLLMLVLALAWVLCTSSSLTASIFNLGTEAAVFSVCPLGIGGVGCSASAVEVGSGCGSAIGIHIVTSTGPLELHGGMSEMVFGVRWCLV